VEDHLKHSDERRSLPPQMKARCLAPKQASDVGKTFGPLSGTVNSTREQTEYEAPGEP
jgi:hypothetical protein